MVLRLAAGLFFLCVGSVATAQTVVQSPVLTLDQDRMYEQSLFGQRVFAVLKERADALSEENQRIDTALTEEEKSLTEERPTMDPADFRALAIDFDERVTAIRRAQSEKEATIQRLGDTERARFFDLAYPILFSLVEDAGAVAILSNQAIILSVRPIDITDRAIQRINQAIGASPLEDSTGPLPVQRPQTTP